MGAGKRKYALGGISSARPGRRIPDHLTALLNTRPALAYSNIADTKTSGHVAPSRNSVRADHSSAASDIHPVAVVLQF